MSPIKPVRSLRCPSCRNLVLRSDENFPFCSDRCRLIDLGKWASGGYVVSTPIADSESGESEYSDVEDRPKAIHRRNTDGSFTDPNDSKPN